jgi:2-phospho-L-lactate/phosphoenolpyruvate guanylyltransferase
VLAIVPVKGLEGAKTRLAPALPASGRAELVLRMLDAVLAACRAASAVDAVLVVSPDPAMGRGADVLVDAGDGHGPAIAAALADPRAAGGALVVMADCPLATPASLDALAAAADPVALVAAEDGGLTAIALADPTVMRPVFGVPGSAALTVARARAAGLVPAVLVDPALAFDVDRPADLARLPQAAVA